ncbi:MAG: helix-turn-helix transcriptional regulator [Burkholderiales bacterium]|nr:helix-turn-helix transcriptional regulator [Opitutaceae bacterium]
MNAGATIPTPVETTLQNIQLRVQVSRRLHLSAWSLELFSPFWRLYVNDRSGAFVRTNERVYDLEPGNLYLIPAWVEFSTGLNRPVVHDFIHFYVSGFPVMLHSRLFNRPLTLACDDLLGSLRDRWRGCAARGSPREWPDFGWASALAHAALANVLAGLETADREASAQWLTKAEEVRPALVAIETHLADPPTNARLAALCGRSENHFVRVFSRAMGLTPARYGLERRLEVAASGLVGTNRSIELIAAETGFTDRFHFSRAFKARFKCAPAAYRRTHRRGD